MLSSLRVPNLANVERLKVDRWLGLHGITCEPGSGKATLRPDRPSAIQECARVLGGAMRTESTYGRAADLLSQARPEPS